MPTVSITLKVKDNNDVSYWAEGTGGGTMQRKLGKAMSLLDANDALKTYVQKRRDNVRLAMDYGEKEVSWKAEKNLFKKIIGYFKAPYWANLKEASFREAERIAEAGAKDFAMMATSIFHRFAADNGFTARFDTGITDRAEDGARVIRYDKTFN